MKVRDMFTMSDAIIHVERPHARVVLIEPITARLAPCSSIMFVHQTFEVQ